MPNKNYISGYNFEQRVKRYFEKKGYYVVRSAGSKGQIDLVAIPTLNSSIRASDVLLIQCKHGAKISKKERDELLDLADDMPLGTKCIVAWAKPNSKITFLTWKWCINETKWSEIEL